MITVFTPTYNRAYILPKLYESLCIQTVKDFEWLVINDGSTDNTEELIASYIAEAKITIRYIKQENGGKHRAINRGAIEAKGELFSIVDSDDYLNHNALESLNSVYINYKDDNNVAAFLNPIHFEGKKVYNGSLVCCKMRNFCNIHSYVTEYWETFKTDVIRSYPFPDVKGESFCSESIVFLTITEIYNNIFFGGNFYNAAYINDGLTVNSLKMRVNNPEYAKLVYLQQIKLSYKILRSHINYFRFSFHSKYSISFLGISYLMIWTVIFGYFIYIYDNFILLKR